jgi:hypothetical protein
MVQPTIVAQQREDGAGRHETALVGRSCRGLAGITPTVTIGRSREGDWGIRPPTGGSRVAATEARTVTGRPRARGFDRVAATIGVEKMVREDFPILNSLFLFDFQAGGIIIRKKYLGNSGEILHVCRL